MRVQAGAPGQDGRRRGWVESGAAARSAIVSAESLREADILDRGVGC
jgi:hypothetical protein